MAAPWEDSVDESLTAALAANTDMAKLISTLPLETRCPPYPLRQVSGFWLPEESLPGLAAVHSRFELRPDDVFLTSFPKSGTTWLKALAFATLNRVRHPPSEPEHPLRRCTPHDCVPFIDLAFAFNKNGDAADLLAALPSPRVLATHLPYNLLPEGLRGTAEAGSGCRIVYVCRDPKDAFVSGYLFTQKNLAAAAEKVNGDIIPPASYTVEEAFELFCDGRCIGCPQWRHVLGYWEASRRRPDNVLFLKYEEMLLDPVGNLKRLAEFLRCPFSDEEDLAGTVDAVVELCSLESLKGSKPNQSGVTTEVNVESRFYFRNGTAGDWCNHLTPEMAARLDEIVAGALQGSGFTFGIDTGDDST